MNMGVRLVEIHWDRLVKREVMGRANAMGEKWYMIEADSGEVEVVPVACLPLWEVEFASA